MSYQTDNFGYRVSPRGAFEPSKPQRCTIDCDGDNISYSFADHMVIDTWMGDSTWRRRLVDNTGVHEWTYTSAMNGHCEIHPNVITFDNKPVAERRNGKMVAL